VHLLVMVVNTFLVCDRSLVT